MAKSLNSQETLWVDALELKEIFHSYGVNLKCLPAVHNEVSNKHVKKYIQTVMAAKIAKDLINEICLQSRSEGQKGKENPAILYEDCIRSFVEGNSASS